MAKLSDALHEARDRSGHSPSICGEFSMGIFHGNIYLGASWEYDGNILGQNAI